MCRHGYVGALRARKPLLNTGKVENTDLARSVHRPVVVHITHHLIRSKDARRSPGRYPGECQSDHQRCERGFTFLEVMISLAVLSVGLLGLASMQIVSIKGAQNAAETSLAVNLANSALDELTLADFTTLLPSGFPGFPKTYDKQGAEVTGGTAPYFTVAVTYQTAGISYIDVIITTKWVNELDTAKTRTITVNGRIRQRGKVGP